MTMCTGDYTVYVGSRETLIFPDPSELLCTSKKSWVQGCSPIANLAYNLMPAQSKGCGNLDLIRLCMVNESVTHRDVVVAYRSNKRLVWVWLVAIGCKNLQCSVEYTKGKTCTIFSPTPHF